MTPTLVHPSSAPRAGLSSARRLGDALTLLLVTVLSLVLLVYVGFGEGKRIYTQLYIDSISAQAGFVRSSMESFLRRGLPMSQYVGFATLTEPLVESEEIAAIIAYDQSGREIFRNVEKSGSKTIPVPPGIQRVGESVTVHVADGFYQITLPLRSRFETAGSLVVTSRIADAVDRVADGFAVMPLLAIALSMLFAAAAAVAGPRIAAARLPWLQIGYAVTFLAMASMVVWTLVALYAEGIQGKTRALAGTLGQRIGEIFELNLSLRDFDGLDRAFADYQRLNPDLSAVALLVGGQVRIHTSADKVGRPWIADPLSYEYRVPVPGATSDTPIEIAVSVPRDMVYRQVARSVKNFAALFVATAFIAGLFLQVAVSLQRVGLGRGTVAHPLIASPQDEAALGVIKPLFFVAVFLEHMTYSFLPQFMQQAAASAELSTSFASLPFMAYYLAFAISLIPSGHVARTIGPRILMCGGLVLAGLGLATLALPFGFWAVLGARVAAGIGQGMLFIGVQSYIMATAAPGQKTQGNAIIVFGFQAGMISGMAIGSLLATYTGPSRVFELAGVVAAVTAIYAYAVVPAARAVHREAMPTLGATVRRLGQDISQVLRNGEFMRTMLLIGIPAKAALTGIITFALPLLLAQATYRQEDIGQIIMLYAMAVVAASHYASRLADRTRRTSRMLFVGAVTSGAGMFAVGLDQWSGLAASASPVLHTAVVMVGVVIVGIAHGCINAPVITHIAELDLTKRIGADSATATYRFLERAGHIAGPIMVGQLFLILGTTSAVVAWLGAATILLGCIFLAVSRPDDHVVNPLRRVA